MVNNEEGLVSDNCPGPIVRRIEEAILATGIPKRGVRTAIIEITGISKGALVKWFSGDTQAPRVEHIDAISDHLDVDLRWLIKGIGYSPLTEDPAFLEGVDDHSDTHPSASALTGRIRKILLAANVPCLDIPPRLAEICALPIANIEAWGDGSIQPQADELAAISKYYGVDLLWLITGTLTPPPEKHESSGYSLNNGDIKELGNVLLLPSRASSYRN